MRKIVLAILLLMVVLFSCDTTYHETIPYKKVDFTIYPDDVMYYRLNTYGGYEYFTGGVNGVVVYRYLINALHSLKPPFVEMDSL